MHRIHVGVVALSAVAVASASAGVVEFMASDGNKLLMPD